MIKLKSVKKSGGSEIYSIQKDGVEIGAVRRVTSNTDRPKWRSTSYEVFMSVSSKRLHPRFVYSDQEHPCKVFRTKQIHCDRLINGCHYESALVARKRLLTWLNDEYACIEQTNNQ